MHTASDETMSSRTQEHEDLLHHGSLANYRIGLSYVVATNLVNDAVLRHNCDPLAAHLLGRAVGGALLLSGGLYADERYNLRWQYEGCVRTILIDVGGDGTLRGFISPAQLAEIGVSKDALFGEGGQMTVVRSRSGRVLNSGTVQSILHDVVDDLSYYLSISDQVETVMTVLIAFHPNPARPVKLVRGLMLQAMPDTDLEQFDRIREELKHERVRAILSQEAESERLLPDIVNALVREEVDPPGLTFNAAPSPRFQCTCSRDKMDVVVCSLSYADRMDILQKGEPLRINCQFCNHRYVMSMEECRTAWTGEECA